MTGALWLRAGLFIMTVQVGVVAAIPWLLAGPDAVLSPGSVLGLAGGVLILLGAGVLLWGNHAFVARGLGTAAPYEPPVRLVSTGLYRHLRNPMYLAAIVIVVGEAALLRSTDLLAYAGVLVIAYNAFVRLYEEPTLRRRFGESYAQYCAQVPRWFPRLSPNQPR